MENRIVSAAVSVLTNRCPKCHKGHFFETDNPFHWKKALTMNDKCAHCGQTFEPEPGFYYGGMYASYGLSVGIGFVAFLICFMLLDIDILVSVIVSSVALLLSTTLIFRMGRGLWLSLFVKYEKGL